MSRLLSCSLLIGGLYLASVARDGVAGAQELPADGLAVSPGPTLPDAPSAGAMGESRATDALPEPTDAAVGIAGAINAGKWGLAAGFALSLLVYLARALGSWRAAWFGSRAAGYALNFGISGAVVLSTALLSGMGFSLALLGAAIAAGFTASGIHTTAKDVSGKGAKTP